MKPHEKIQAVRAAYREYVERLPAEHRKHEGATFVPGVGPLSARIALVGEAPGAQEDKQGKPFVGPAGQELDRVLDLNLLRRDRIYVTNVVKFRPPNNSTPKSWERTYGRACLSVELGVIEPDLAILAGATAFNTVFPGRKFGEWVGHIVCTDVRDYMAVWHPSSCLRNPEHARDNDGYFRIVRRYDG